MNLQELISAVYTETNRPDLVDETLQAILEATLSVHTCEQFPKDIVEATVTFDDPLLHVQTLDTTAIPNYRSVAYIRKFDPGINSVQTTGNILPNQNIYRATQFNFLKRVDIGDIVDRYGYEKTDVWYQAGNLINIKSTTALAYVTLAWYRYPDLDPTGANFSSWIANEGPWCIVYKASGQVYAKIGEDKSSAIYLRQPTPGQSEETGGSFYQQLAILKRNNILAGT
jgi:hypothetical protein